MKEQKFILTVDCKQKEAEISLTFIGAFLKILIMGQMVVYTWWDCSFK